VTDQARAAPTPHPLIAPGTSTEEDLRQPIALFRNFYDALVDSEKVLDLQGLFAAVASAPKVYGEKKRIPLVILGELRSAPYIGKTAEKHGTGPGKQRSNKHIVALGPGVLFDIDRVPVEEISRRLTILGISHVVYTTWSSDDPPSDGKVRGRGRVILFADGTWGTDEHKAICAVINEQLLDRAADTNAFTPAQGFALHAIKAVGQRTFTHARHGAKLSLVKIRKLMAKTQPKGASGDADRATTTPDDLALAEAREIGALGCVDDEPHWFKMVQSIKRTSPHPPYPADPNPTDPNDPIKLSKHALDVADAMSAVAAGYVSRADVEAKMKRPDPSGLNTKFDFVRSWAKACAVAIIERANSQIAANVLRFRLGPISKVFDGVGLPKARLDDGLSESIGGGMEPPESLDPSHDNVRRAALYLAGWWPPHVIDDLLRQFQILSKHVIEIDAAKVRYAAQQEQKRDNSKQSIVAEFNERYAVVSDEGDTVIYHRQPNPQHWQSAYVPMNFEDLRKLYQNRRVNVGNDRRAQWVSVAEMWLDHPDRKTYPGGLGCRLISSEPKSGRGDFDHGKVV